jgi:capsular exopolysaccharide synthesis family protein
MKRILKVLIAFAFGLAFTCGMAFLLNYLDNTIKTPLETEQLLGLPVFACVPLAKDHSLTDKRAFPVVGTSYEMLCANLWANSSDTGGRTFLVASAEPNVGRSSTAANLAITLALDGGRVVLVDADLRQPSLHKLLGVDNEKGLSNVLAGQLPVRDAVKKTSITDLMVVTSGPKPANPVRLLRSGQMSNTVAELSQLADFVIFDCPAGVTFADATLLASSVKNVILVHAAGTIARGAEDEFRSRLDQVNANLVGAVLNMAKPEDSHGYYHFRRSYGELAKDTKQIAALPGGSSRNP